MPTKHKGQISHRRQLFRQIVYFSRVLTSFRTSAGSGLNAGGGLEGLLQVVVHERLNPLGDGPVREAIGVAVDDVHGVGGNGHPFVEVGGRPRRGVLFGRQNGWVEAFS